MTELVIEGSVTARAHVNIALVKYWGKAMGAEANLPAVPSLSLTLDSLSSTTTVRFAPSAPGDTIRLNGVLLGEQGLLRAKVLMDRVRELADVVAPFEVESRNTVPTAAGLASSASGMAALATATARCAGLDVSDRGLLSELARCGSGSASRSVFGGWSLWDGPRARQLAPVDHWSVALVVAVIDSGPKSIDSRRAMERTRRHSPYYAGWVEDAPALCREGVAAVQRRDLEALVEVMELSALRMHAAAMATRPPILYWAPASLSVMRAVERLRREQGVLCGWTMDAGPNVKVLCHADDAERVVAELSELEGVGQTLVCRPGPGVEVWCDGDEVSA